MTPGAERCPMRNCRHIPYVRRFSLPNNPTDWVDHSDLRKGTAVAEALFGSANRAVACVVANRVCHASDVQLPYPRTFTHLGVIEVQVLHREIPALATGLVIQTQPSEGGEVGEG